MNFGAQATRLCSSARPIGSFGSPFHAAKRSSACTNCSGVDHSRIQINQTFLIPVGLTIIQGLGQTCGRLANYGIADKPSACSGRSRQAAPRQNVIELQRLSFRGRLIFCSGGNQIFDQLPAYIGKVVAPCHVWPLINNGDGPTCFDFSCRAQHLHKISSF